MSKKILSVALALIFVISTFAVSAFAVGGAAFEEDADAYTQAWRLEELDETDGTYSVGVYLETNYKVGAIQFQIANDDGNAVLEGVDSEIFAAPDFDVQWTEDGLVFIVPTPVDSGATAVDATTEILVATLSYTLKDGASSATLAIVDDAKSEANPGGSLIAVRMSDDNLVTGTMIYGQTATVEEGITIGAAAAPADLAVKAAYASAGIIIDKNKTLGGAYDGVVYGFALPDAGVSKLAANFYTDRLCDTTGAEITVVASKYARGGYGTGTTIQVKEGTNVVKTYVVVLFGDIDGNSFINAQDATRISAEFKTNGTFDLVQIMACNIVVAGRTDAQKADGLYKTLIGDYTRFQQVVSGRLEIQVDMAAGHYTYHNAMYA